MTKDRDQLTPAEPDDRQQLQPRRSAAREATGAVDASTGPGPASAKGDPRATDEVGPDEAGKYRDRG
jgi:hypothetical protein